jgi:predicted RNase H-like nuclease (RuvC/YqgF family)
MSGSQNTTPLSNRQPFTDLNADVPAEESDADENQNTMNEILTPHETCRSNFEKIHRLQSAISDVNHQNEELERRIAELEAELEEKVNRLESSSN